MTSQILKRDYQSSANLSITKDGSLWLTAVFGNGGYNGGRRGRPHNRCKYLHRSTKIRTLRVASCAKAWPACRPICCLHKLANLMSCPGKQTRSLTRKTWCLSRLTQSSAIERTQLLFVSSENVPIWDCRRFPPRKPVLCCFTVTAILVFNTYR